QAGELAGDGHVELRALRLEGAVEMGGVRGAVGQTGLAVHDEAGGPVKVWDQEGELLVRATGRGRHQQRERERAEDPARHDASLSSEGRLQKRVESSTTLDADWPKMWAPVRPITRGGGC